MLPVIPRRQDMMGKGDDGDDSMPRENTSFLLGRVTSGSYVVLAHFIEIICHDYPTPIQYHQDIYI